jgi:hypothetical protein
MVSVNDVADDDAADDDDDARDAHAIDRARVHEGRHYFQSFVRERWV